MFMFLASVFAGFVGGVIATLLLSPMDGKEVSLTSFGIGALIGAVAVYPFLRYCVEFSQKEATLTCLGVFVGGLAYQYLRTLL